jgi:hypothetical protein
MSDITKPIMLDETGRAIVNALMQNDIVTQKEAEISNYADAKLQTILDEIPPSYSEILHIVESISAFVTPEQFGAKGDGISDDTEAIQSALDSNYPVVFYSNHSYKISDTLVINHPKVVYGNNARIFASTSENEYADGMIDVDSTEDVTLYNLYVDGNATAACGVLISQSTNISIIGCKIIGIENATNIDCQGIRLHRSNKCSIYNAYIVGVEYKGTARKSARGILYNLCTGCIVENSYISNVFAPKSQPAGDGDGRQHQTADKRNNRRSHRTKRL